jgi:predicted MFS family arabinose efflux permease
VFGAAFMLSAIVVVWRAVPSLLGDPSSRPPFDFIGAALLGIGLALLLLAVSEGPIWGWVSPATIAMFGSAVVLLTAWVLVEARSAHPLINLRVLRERDIVLANGTALALGATMYMVLSMVSLVAQAPSSTGYGVAMPLVWAGMVMVPFSVGSIVANRAIRAFRSERSASLALPLAAAMVMVSAMFLALLHDQAWHLLLGMFINGLGVGASYAAMPGLIARRVAIEEFGSAVSVNQVMRTIGGSIGSAIAGAAIAATMLSEGFPSTGGVAVAFFISAGGSALTALLLFVNHFRRPR